MKFLSLPLLLMLVVAAPNESRGFGINVEAEVKLGDRFWIIRKIRKKRYAKLRQGIHERITLEALDDAERRQPYAARHPKLRKQVVYGLLFNDDPGGYLFPKTDGNPRGYKYTRDSGNSTVNGIKWMEKFGVVVARMKRLYLVKKEELSQKRFVGWIFRSRGARERPQLEEKLKKDILWASHFGDLQYLHSMGLGHEGRGLIIARMRGYSEHAWSAAIGAMTFKCFKAEIRQVKNRDHLNKGARPSSSMNKCPIIRAAHAKRKRQLLMRFDEYDALYHTNDAKEFKYRALGSILHMIQDSYAKGHTVREGWDDQNSGRIMYFQNYAEQDGDKHGAFDTHSSQKVDNWNKIPGAMKAMERSSALISYFTLQCSWKGSRTDRSGCPAKGVASYLFDDIFKLADLSGAEMATRSHDKLRKTE
jgi:hypothetical protein